MFAAHAGAEIRVGILPRLNPVELYTMFKPFADYLSRETGEKTTLVIPRDFEAFKAMFRSGQMDIGFANSIIYVQLRQEALVEPLALAAEKKAGTKFRGILIARKDGDIKCPRDLKGKTLVFVDQSSAGGYIFQMMLLRNEGLDIRRDFTLLPFAKSHANVALAVFNRMADAGGIREDDFDKMRSKMDVSQLAIVGYTDYFPNWPVFAGPTLNKDTTARVKTALLKLRRHEPRAAAVLGPAKLAGFAPVSDREYDRLRQAARLVGAL
jgi:phosphonate transport system substrate-binding protein